jgi:hypothetical protein
MSYGKGEYRDAWHRRQFELIYRDWHKGTHTEEVMKEVGGNSVRVWQSKGGEGSSLWWKGALISKDEWRDMMRREKEKRLDMAKRAQERKRVVEEERRADKLRQKKEEQAKKMAAAQAKSRDRHKRILMKVSETGCHRGGLFEATWRQGRGCWVRTRKQRGRNLWMESMPTHVNVRDAKGGRVDKGRMRTAVIGGWYTWDEEERVSENIVTVHGEIRVQEEVAQEHQRQDEGGLIERRMVRGEGNKAHRSHLRPRWGPQPTPTTPTLPATATTGDGEDTRWRRKGFHPREGIG